MKPVRVLLRILWMCTTSAHVLAGIPPAYATVAYSKGVPPAILYAIALTESGYQYPLSATRKTDYRPWPWSLNIGGRSCRFSNRQGALQKLKAAIAKGYSVDGGLLQINWYWHKHRFNRIEQLIDPNVNLAIGADILAEQFQRTGSWWRAIGAYHAPGQDKASLQRAESYRQRVFQKLKTLHLTTIAVKQP